MLGILRWVAKQIGTYWDALSAIFGWVLPIAGGVMTGWAAWATGIFSTYAPLSWVVVGVAGAGICALIFWIASKATFWLAQAKWARTWGSPGDGVNPLDDNFVRKRIKINDFVSPAHQIIEGKVFDRCELIGPTLVLLHQNVNFQYPQMLDCNFVCCKENFIVYNATILKDCNLFNCKLYRITFLITESAVGSVPPGILWLSRTPSEFNMPVPWPEGTIPGLMPTPTTPAPPAKPASEKSFPPPL